MKETSYKLQKSRPHTVIISHKMSYKLHQKLEDKQAGVTTTTTSKILLNLFNITVLLSSIFLSESTAKPCFSCHTSLNVRETTPETQY